MSLKSRQVHIIAGSQVVLSIFWIGILFVIYNVQSSEPYSFSRDEYLTYYQPGDGNPYKDDILGCMDINQRRWIVVSILVFGINGVGFSLASLLLGIFLWKGATKKDFKIYNRWLIGESVLVLVSIVVFVVQPFFWPTSLVFMCQWLVGLTVNFYYLWAVSSFLKEKKQMGLPATVTMTFSLPQPHPLPPPPSYSEKIPETS